MTFQKFCIVRTLMPTILVRLIQLVVRRPPAGWVWYAGVEGILDDAFAERLNRDLKVFWRQASPVPVPAAERQKEALPPERR